MAGINKAIILGNVGMDPEMRYTQGGLSVASVRLATSETWKDKTTGEQQERTEWHSVSFFGKLAEIVGEYVHKGDKLYVEGRIETQKWQGQDGQDRYTTKIIAKEMQMLSPKSNGSGGGATGAPAPAPSRPSRPPPRPAPTPPPAAMDPDDDIPF